MMHKLEIADSKGYKWRVKDFTQYPGGAINKVIFEMAAYISVKTEIRFDESGRHIIGDPLLASAVLQNVKAALI